MVDYVSCFETWVGVDKKGEIVLVYGKEILCEEVWILLSELVFTLVFTFPCELKTSPGVPSNLNGWNAALLQSFNFTIHDLYWFLNKMKLVVNMESIQQND
ncbi:hypothetical protein Tco_1098735 [Tanacetum coccineum]